MSGKKSFSTRLSLNILLVTSVLFLLAIGIASVSSHILIAEEAQNSSDNLLDATITKIEKSLMEVEAAVQVTAWIADGRKDKQEALYYLTHEMVARTDKIKGCAIAFKPYYFENDYYFSPYSYREEDGSIHTKQLGSQSYDYFYMDWYQIPALTGEPCWSEPYFDEGGGKFYMSTYSFPLKDRNGEVFAIVTADVSVEWIAELLEGIKPYSSSHVSLVSRSGAYINIDSGSRFIGETVYSTLTYVDDDDDEVDSLVYSMMSGKKGMRKYSRSHKVSFAVYGPLENGWILSISCDYRDVLKRTSQMNLILVVIGLVGLLLIFIFCYIVIRKLTRPLTTFSESAIRIAKGDFSAPLPEIKSEDEIRQLRNSFEYMQNSLTSYIEDLKNTTAANERFASELNIASNIQMAMLPKNFPNLENIDLYAILKPAKEVGGDLYDFYVKDRQLHFAIGDVSGKGVPAALIMAITRAAFRFVSGLGLPVNEVVENINDALSEGNEAGMFVTMFVGCLDLDTGELQYCNAGHNPVIINGEFLDVKPNIAVGLFSGFKYQMQSVKLERGSRIVLYTDGVSEAERADKAQYGDERLLDWSRHFERYHGARQACEGLLDSVHEFVDGNAQNDDITICTIKLK